MPHHVGFTLIELLVVIAIIAVLAVVVVLTLNPAGLLQESRDANRLSDMATVNSAIGLSLADNPSASLGSSSILFLSVPDPSATSTLGDQCQGLGLLALPVTFSWHCAASSTYRRIDGTGWIPVNLGQTTFGSSLSQLPVDPINVTSSGLYYGYATNGQQYEITSLFESQKYRSQYGANPQVPGYPEVNAKGSNLTLSPIFNPLGLVGYWPLDEGAGSAVNDFSGNNATGTWFGPLGSQWTAGKVGSSAGSFNGTTTYVGVSKVINYSPTFTISAWFKISTPGVFAIFCSGRAGDNSMFLLRISGTFLEGWTLAGPSWPTYSISGSRVMTDGQWHLGTFVVNGTSLSLYEDGVLDQSTTNGFNSSFNQPAYIGAYYDTTQYFFPGSIDDVRIYNRALSAAEVQAIYNGEK